jgi:sugar phosphate isomerase/epimerase
VDVNLSLELPFRLGTTSYIIPDDIVPNVHFLARQVQDIELVLFEVEDGANNLPDDAALATLADAALKYGLTYTVHLPLDLRLGDGGEEGHLSLRKARRVIECTRTIQPFAYVVHLDGKQVITSASTASFTAWVDQAVRSLEITASWAGHANLLAVENLEGYPPDFWEPVLERIPVSRCMDIGHLWLDRLDPLPILEAALPRTRVVHLHGIAGRDHQDQGARRDHQSLAHVPEQRLDRVFQLLLARGYKGVVTLEVFNEADFISSIAAVHASILQNKNRE